MATSLAAKAAYEYEERKRMATLTVATLPATANIGTRKHVSDALTPVRDAIVVGGGAVGVSVYFDGTNWRVVA